MIIVDQQTVEAIRSARLRLREITLPVRYGSQGERKRCQATVDKAVTLVGRLSERDWEPYYEPACREADAQPTRARAVLWLIDTGHWKPPRKTVKVTPTIVERVGEKPADRWHIRFVKGDQSVNDGDVFLKRTLGYSTVRDELDAGVVMYQSADAMAKARTKAREKRDQPTSNGAAALRLAHRRLATRKHAMSVQQRRQLDRVGKAIEKLAGELALDSGAIFALSPSPSHPEAPAANGDTASTGSDSCCPSST